MTSFEPATSVKPTPARPPGSAARPGRFGEPTGAGPAAPSSSAAAAEPLSRSPRSFAPAVKPTPLPKRSKGRLLVGAVMSTTLATVGCFMWDAWFRYEALGTVVGRVVQVSSPLAGTVESTRVRQGDVVHQGEPLATVRNLELQHRLAASGDQLRIAQATLEAELAKLRWRSHTLGSDNRKAVAEYYEVWGRLLSEQAKLADLELKLQRARALAEREAVSAGEHDSVRLETEGQRANVEKLAAAVEEMRHRAELDAQLDETEAAQLKPLTAITETLPSEIERLRLQVDQGEIVAPVDGRIISRQHYAGEYVGQGETLYELLADDSLQIVLYVPEERAHRFVAGQQLEVLVAPQHTRVRCQVVRQGERMEAPPQHLARYYRSDRYLVPIYLLPEDPSVSAEWLRLDCEVRLPRWSF